MALTEEIRHTHGIRNATVRRRVQHIYRYSVEQIDGGCKYKGKNTEFTYITKREFKTLLHEKQAEAHLGYTKIKAYDVDKDDDTEVIEIVQFPSVEEEKQYFETKIKNKKPTFWYVKGLVHVGNGLYVHVCKSWLLLFLIIVLLLGGVCVPIVCNIIPPPQIEDTQPEKNPAPEYDEDQIDWDGELPKNGDDSEANSDMTQFPGYSVWVVSKQEKSVGLINPNENTVDFTYTIYDAEGTEQYTTSKIRPGKYVPLEIYRLYTIKGTYDLTLVVKTYDTVTGEECTGITMPITLVVK